MRDSQYLDEYLDQRDNNPLTPGSFLTYILQGRAKTYSARYYGALMRSLNRLVESGKAETCESVGHAIAYRRIGGSK